MAVRAPSRPSSAARGARSSPSTQAIRGARPCSAATSAQRLREAGGVQAAGVGDDPHALLQRQPEAVRDLGHEGAGVAERGVLEPVLAEDQHGQLGEVVAGDDVDPRPPSRPRAARAWPRAGRRRSRCSCRCAGARPGGLSRAVLEPGRARLPTGAGRAGEGLGEVEPAVGVGPGGDAGRGRRGGGAGSPAGRSRTPSRSRAARRPPDPTSRPRRRGRPARRAPRRPARASPWAPKAKSRVRTPMWATCRIRSVGASTAPRASATSRECAQVSMNRAVAIEVGLIGGPNHGILSPAGTARSASCSARRPARHRSSSAAGGTRPPASASASTNPSGSPMASIT